MGATFPVETTVSILVLLEIALEVHANCLYPSRQRGVSILVLLEIALEADGTTSESFSHAYVSILVLLEIALEVLSFAAIVKR